MDKHPEEYIQKLDHGKMNKGEFLWIYDCVKVGLCTLYFGT